MNQKAIELTQRLEEQKQLARDEAIEPLKQIHASKQLQPNLDIKGATPEETTRLRNLDIMRRANMMADYQEGIADLPPSLRMCGSR